MTTKTCTKCGETKPIGEFFSVGKRSPGKFRAACKACTYAASKDYQARNKDKYREWSRNCKRRMREFPILAAIELEKQRRYRKAKPEQYKRADEAYRERNRDRLLSKRLEKQHGITLDEFNSILESQGNKCSCCGTTEWESPHGRHCVDHDHVTGFVRGLLCFKCNVGLGMLGDNAAGVAKALDYASRTKFFDVMSCV